MYAAMLQLWWLLFLGVSSGQVTSIRPTRGDLYLSGDHNSLRLPKLVFAMIPSRQCHKAATVAPGPTIIYPAIKAIDPLKT